MITSFDLDAGTVDLLCSKCSATSQLKLSDLRFGDSIGLSAPPSTVAIRLPVCACGRVGFLIRTFDKCPDAHQGSVFAKQRRAANALSNALIGAGHLHPDAATAIRADGRVPVDVHPDRAAANLHIADSPAPALVPLPTSLSTSLTPEYLALRKRIDDAAAARTTAG